MSNSNDDGLSIWGRSIAGTIKYGVFLLAAHWLAASVNNLADAVRESGKPTPQQPTATAPAYTPNR